MEGRSYANGFKKCKFYSVCLNNDNYNYNLFFFLTLEDALNIMCPKTEFCLLQT